ncbi:uncharacterized protein PY17X_0602500 [Plasmodium yoelii]|uniref:PIR protein n=3 Tax=Plasmodium yoelii TaxID=5861 RepID=A0AAE9WKU9_PLAYO|nr:uncharacterized protein PY17X_0602500 [Plasmodium yoelii]EAA17251.1 putative yir2 protein [Plasmodium yoelii yoelii]WBY55882.1 PIR protein [Plasmodium yoelii yoelii]CDU16877.1 YIR protein [Plasmodium yoelii]VTZ75130.1 PIR protein [Plasmodium yoelii]|eukprot:XP_725686.1 uncharacterized protein PY17X_0602500 [Plasmodium yoelii]
MNDDICSKFDILRNYLPDKLGETGKLELRSLSNFKNYCADENCDTDLKKITIGFLWLLEKNCSISKNTDDYNENNISAFFLYIISWLSYQLNQNSERYFTKISDFYNEYISNNQNYMNLINDDNKCKKLKEIIDKKKDLLDINIKDMSNFYEAFKLLCSVHGTVAMSKYDNTLLGDATIFYNKYAELNDYYNVENTPHSKILSDLLTDYNKLKEKCGSNVNNSIQFPSLPTERATKSFLENSSIKISVIPMIFIFFALIILGITYKRSSSDFRKKLQKFNLRIKKIKRKINH